MKADLLAFFTKCVRVAEAGQIHLLASRATLARLVDRGLLVRHRVLVRWPLPVLSEPLHRHRPKDPAPDYDATAYKTQSRWWNLDTRQITVYVATKKAARLVGGCGDGRIRQIMQVAHDLGVTAMYLAADDDVRRDWLSEDVLRSTGLVGPKDPVPDAMSGELALEFGGAYDARRLERHHENNKHRPYELW